jgi:hypothetical protein
MLPVVTARLLERTPTRVMVLIWLLLLVLQNVSSALFQVNQLLLRSPVPSLFKAQFGLVFRQLVTNTL